jgi:hypothetical protein
MLAGLLGGTTDLYSDVIHHTDVSFDMRVRALCLRGGGGGVMGVCTTHLSQRYAV